MVDKKYYVWEVELFQNDAWVKHTRYYHVAKDHNDFDLKDIEGKRREAWFVGLSELSKQEVLVITDENAKIEKEDGFDWYLPMKEIDRKYKRLADKLGWPNFEPEIHISEFIKNQQPSLLEERIKESEKLFPLKYNPKKKSNFIHDWEAEPEINFHCH